MSALWTIVAGRMLEAIQPARMLDVGDDELGFVQSAATTAAAWGGVVLSLPERAATAAAGVELLAPYAPEAIENTDPVQLVVLHGDCNWWTADWQLRAVAAAADRADRRLPPIVVAGAGPPWGRRDHYRDPDAIPPPGRRPNAPTGNGWAATAEGTPHNGVLTAVEEFAQTRGELELIVVPGLGGVAIVIAPAHEDDGRLRRLLAELRLSPPARELLEAVDRERAAQESRAAFAARQAAASAQASREEVEEEMDALRSRIGELSDRFAAERTRAQLAQARLEHGFRRPSDSAAPPRRRLVGMATGELSDEPAGQLIRDILQPDRLLRALGWPGAEAELSLPIPTDLRGIIDRSATLSLIVLAGDDPLAVRRTLRSICERARRSVSVVVAVPACPTAAISELVDSLSRAPVAIEVVEAGRVRPREGAAQLAAGEELPPGWPDRSVPGSGAAPTVDVAYLLPGMPAEGSGGAKSVVQEARGLRALGAGARVCVPAGALQRAQGLYGNDDQVFVAYAGDREIAQAVGDATVAVATEHTSVPLLARLAQQRPDLGLAYYVQDYEALFAELETARSDRALLSYGAVPGAVRIAKTYFICNVVEALHGVAVVKVAPSLDRSAFHPACDGRQNTKLTVTAMVRPRTPRRRPRTTVAALEMIGEALGDRCGIVTFGCDGDELAEVGGDRIARLTHLGRLNPEAVAQQLRRSDVFLDGSAYQAFGRTALEAMACGAVPVLPSLGGAREFAIDNENAILFDDDSATALAGHVIALADDDSRLRSLQAEAVRTASGYSVERAAHSQLDVFSALAGGPG